MILDRVCKKPDFFTKTHKHMKTLLKLIFLIACFIGVIVLSTKCDAQDSHPQRTIKVKRLVVHNGVVTYNDVLEVQELHNERENVSWPDNCLNCSYKDYWQHIRYLDRFGHKLSKNVVVIETTQLDEVKAYSPPKPAPVLVDTGLVQSFPLTSGAILTVPIDTSNVITGIGGVVELHNYDSADIARIALDELLHDLDPRWGIREAGGMIWLDYHWFPRRLRKRFQKFYHLGKYVQH